MKSNKINATTSSSDGMTEPELVEYCAELRSMVSKLTKENERLKKENKQLREFLAPLEKAWGPEDNDLIADDAKNESVPEDITKPANEQLAIIAKQCLDIL